MIRSFARGPHALTAMLVALAACGGGGDDPPPPDAQEFPAYDFSCMGNAAPTTAADTVTVYGVTQEIKSEDGTPVIRPLGDVTMVACPVGTELGGCTPGPTTMTTSNADGTFAMGAEPTGGVPYDAYLRVEHIGHRTTLLYPSSPLIGDNMNVEVPLMLNAFVAQLAALGLAQDATKAIVGLQLTDCAGLAIADNANVVLRLQQGGAEVTGTTLLNASMFSADFAGAYFILNVPAGATDVGATYKGTPLRGHVITTVAGTSSLTEIRPGY